MKLPGRPAPPSGPDLRVLHLVIGFLGGRLGLASRLLLSCLPLLLPLLLLLLGDLGSLLLGLRLFARLEFPERLLYVRAPRLRVAEFLGQLIAALALAVELVLLGVDALGLVEPALHDLVEFVALLLHSAVAHGLVLRRVRAHLRPVDRDVAQLRHPLFAAHVQDLFEKPTERGGMSPPELGDRVAAQRPAFGWSGCWLAASTRKGTDSCVARSILRELRTPTQCPYARSCVIITG